MPVIRPKSGVDYAREIRPAIEERLVRELLGEGAGVDRPLVFEVPARVEGSMDVVVVWDAWRGIPGADREDLIRDAYSRFSRILLENTRQIMSDRPGTSPTPPPISMAVGATWEEADESNLLPYSVRAPRSHRFDEVDRESMRRLMLAEGAVETSSGGIELRYPTLELAQDAVERFRERLPHIPWGIAERMDPVGD